MISRHSSLAIFGIAAAAIALMPFSSAEENNDEVITQQSENIVVSKMKSPQALYRLRCSGCHQVNGMGSPGGGVPPFPDYLGPMASDQEGRIYIAHVPGVMSARLNDDQLADVLNYLIDVWGENADGTRPKYFTAKELEELKAVPVQNIVEYRRGIVKRLADGGHPVADYPWP